DACYRSVAERVGRWAYRRPLHGDEVDALVDIALDARSWGSGDFGVGLQYELMALLQSPSFLYLVEVGDEDASLGYRRLRPEELATRLSLFLSGRTPDLELLDLAAAGELETAEQIRMHAERLLGS